MTSEETSKTKRSEAQLSSIKSLKKGQRWKDRVGSIWTIVKIERAKTGLCVLAESGIDRNTEWFRKDGTYSLVAGAESPFDFVERVFKKKKQAKKPGLLVEIGKRYVCLSGELSGVIVKNSEKNQVYPLKDNLRGLSYTKDGKFFASDNEINPHDLVAEYVEAAPDTLTSTLPKSTINFWEARNAAWYEGVSVRMVDGDPSHGFDKKDFEEYSWGPQEIESEWIIMEEPKLTSYYLNIYPNSPGSPKISKELADAAANLREKGDRLGCIKFTLDKAGQLVSAENVE